MPRPGKARLPACYASARSRQRCIEGWADRFHAVTNGLGVMGVLEDVRRRLPPGMRFSTTWAAPFGAATADRSAGCAGGRGHGVAITDRGADYDPGYVADFRTSNRFDLQIVLVEGRHRTAERRWP